MNVAFDFVSFLIPCGILLLVIELFRTTDAVVPRSHLEVIFEAMAKLITQLSMLRRVVRATAVTSTAGSLPCILWVRYKYTFFVLCNSSKLLYVSQVSGPVL